MIKINKPAQGPIIRFNRGQHRGERKNEVETESLCNEYDENPDAFQNGRKFNFKNDVYADPTIKASLIACQHGKCCFCESSVTHISHGDVEHFRPKAGYRSNRGEPLTKPGYYWLAYDWSNLLFSCQICNQRNKENLFPLLNEAERAKSHHDEIQNEHPVFINPALEDPSDFIGFRKEYAVAKDDNIRGRVTIEELGLNDERNFGIVEERRKYLATFLSIAEIINLANQNPDIDYNLIEKAEDIIKKAKIETERYAGMIRENFPETHN